MTAHFFGKDMMNISDKAKLAAFKRERKFAPGENWRHSGAMNFDWEKLQLWALAEVEATLAQLPEPLLTEGIKVPVTFEPKPNRGLQADGIETDTLGLFTGAELADAETILPSQIILFLENIWAFAEDNEEKYRREIRRTFLHELGHYLGLGEEDLQERGMD